MLKIKNIESFKLYYIYFFPVVFFPFLNIYQFRNDPDIKSWLFRNLLISFTVVVTLFFLALSMLITKFLYKDQNKNTDFFSVGLGFLCLIFLMGSNYYNGELPHGVLFLKHLFYAEISEIFKKTHSGLGCKNRQIYGECITPFMYSNRCFFCYMRGSFSNKIFI